MLNKEHYDIVFLDHMMPEMDGIEVLNRLKANPQSPNKNTPIIMLTANAMMGADQKYLESGFTDYLSKPIRPLDLENMVLKHLPAELIIRNENPDTQSAIDEPVSHSNWVNALSFIDTNAGLEFAAGDEDFYKQILTTYVTEDKRPALSDFLAKEDWPNYQIVAHSLKGTSLTIGAAPLSAAAKELEFAVKENRYDYIKEHHDDVMKEYGELLDKLKNVLKNA